MNMEHRRQVSKAEIEQARKLDLLSYLQQYEPQELVKVASGVYSTRSHDSLKISHGKWYRWSTGVGGVSALDYLIKVRDMHFVDAVLHLRDCLRFMQPIQGYTSKAPKRSPFILPKPNHNNDRAIDYLMRRGIGAPLLRVCVIRAGCTRMNGITAVLWALTRRVSPVTPCSEAATPPPRSFGRLRAATSDILSACRRRSVPTLCICLRAP